MTNTVYGPYTKSTWTDGVTALNQTRMSNLENQAQTAINGFNPDETGPFVLSGITCTKDGTTANQLDIASGTAYVTMSDGTIGKIAVVSDNTHTTSTPSTTYHLYLQPDGTWYWSTSNSPATHSLAICDVATDGSGNISTVTDKRHTGGSLGGPLIVARTISQVVSGTGAVNVLAYAVSVTGLYRISAAFYIGRSGTSTITLAVQASAGDNPALTPAYSMTLQGGSTLSALAVAGAGQWSTLPSLIFAAAGHNIDVHYTDATATVADNVTVVIERLT